MTDLMLDTLKSGLPGITSSWGCVLSEASVACFASHRHESGIEMPVNGLEDLVLSVFWEDNITEQIRCAWADTQEMTEFGACGVAIALVLKLTPFTVIRRARKGTGIDYWLGHRACVFAQDAARLEISGILSGNSSEIRTRVAQKLKQTIPTDGELPVYVVVVEFSQPAAQMVRK